MRTLLLFVTFALGFLSVSAETDSWKKACRSGKGTYVVLKDGSESYPSCIFGEAVIAAESFYLYKDEQVQVAAIKAYKQKKSSGPKGGVCGSYDAELITAKDKSGYSYHLCRFSDQSFMEETTLWLGPGSLSSEVMDETLNKTLD